MEKIFDRIFGAIFTLAIVAVLGYALVQTASADTGHEGATRKEIGSYGGTRSLNLSSTAATEIFAPDTKRPDGWCRNNSAYVIWVGTNSGTTHNTAHENIRIGVPIKSSETFTLNGSYTGNWYANSDTAAGATGANLRCQDGLVR